jgi:sensor histidine kinase regulating citrate/malate metabolism
MNKPLLLSLKVKLGLLVAMLILIIMLVVAYTSVIRQERSMRNEMRAKAINMAQITGALALLGGNGTDPWAFAKQFLKFAPQLDNNILYVIITDAKNNIVDSEINTPLLTRIIGHDSDRLTNEIPEAVKAHLVKSDQGQSEAVYERLGHVLPIDVVLKPANNLIGTMSIGYSLYMFDSSVKTARTVTLLFTLGFIVLGIMASFGLSLNITKPIYKIVEAMKNVERGDLNQHFDVKKRFEMQMIS